MQLISYLTSSVLVCHVARRLPSTVVSFFDSTSRTGSLKYLCAEGNQLANLSGIEALGRPTKVDASNNSIANTPDLEALENLRLLKMVNSPITADTFHYGNLPAAALQVYPASHPLRH